MADKKVHIIRVGKGNVDPRRLVVRRQEGVAWVPKTTNVTVKVTFTNKSPFDEIQIPGSAGVVYRIVKKNADLEEYSYKEPGSPRKRDRADPVIIVRGDRRKTKRKAAARKK